MRSARRRLLVLVGLVIVVGATGAAAYIFYAAAPGAPGGPQDEAISISSKPSGAIQVRLYRDADANMVYQIGWDDGQTQTLNAEAYAQLLYDDAHNERGLFFIFLNISSPIGVAWVCLGLLGQIVFAGRMIVQWLASEKHRRSVVPTAFWWMSLIGATMLTIYFVWRVDVVAILGQVTGWLIYVRNLWLIHRPPTPNGPVLLGDVQVAPPKPLNPRP